MTTQPWRPLRTICFADSQSRTNTCTCGGSIGSDELAEELADQHDPFAKRRRSTLDPDAIGAGKADASVLLHEQDQLARVERRLLDELQRRTLGSRVDLRHAERARGEAQPMTREQRLHRLRCRSEAVDELLAQPFELF